jgi:hypothetical protein
MKRVSATDMAHPPMTGIFGIKRLMAIAVPITYVLFRETKKTEYRLLFLRTEMEKVGDRCTCETSVQTIEASAISHRPILSQRGRKARFI